MTERVPCVICGALILPSTAVKTDGRCMPCKQGIRQSIEDNKRRRAEAIAHPSPTPHEIISDIVKSYAGASDQKILDSIKSLPSLVDETEPQWNDDAYWLTTADPFIALADVAAERKLRPAIQLLLDRACFGDPGEIMRGLRHSFEAIVNPDWDALSDICLRACASKRQGTRLWAIHQLAILDDPRAKPIFEQAVQDGPKEIRWIAEIGMKRLSNFQGLPRS
jgi:hypothetical protein